MIFSGIKPEFRDASFPKAKNALTPNYLTKKCKILFRTFQKSQKSKHRKFSKEKNKKETKMYKNHPHIKNHSKKLLAMPKIDFDNFQKKQNFHMFHKLIFP